MFDVAACFEAFQRDLSGTGALDRLRDGVIGDGIEFEGPFGTKKLLYADYTASGRALRQVETFILEKVLPFYANTHTEASLCGMIASRLREEARRIVARLTGTTDSSHVIFNGSGATAGLNRLVMGLDLAARVRNGEKIVVISGPYEHHSNILPWRESGAEVICLPEAPEGGPDMKALDEALLKSASADLIIGAFSAGSNVTGILTDTDEVTRRLKAAGALAIWDYAAAAPYVDIQMGEGESAKDAIVFSPHKFLGGPSASGVLILRKGTAWRDRPAQPGGGTVRFVSPWDAQYSANLVAREEAGTPNVIGDIRVALVMLVKEAIGLEVIAQREEALRQQAIKAWKDHPRIELLGQIEGADALPIFSFRIRNEDGGYIHHQLFTRLLSDHEGIQVRGGCACAGPYAHQLLTIDQSASIALNARLDAGHELEKPGWVRLNFSFIHSDAQASQIIAAVLHLADAAAELAQAYQADPRNARFTPMLIAAQ